MTNLVCVDWQVAFSLLVVAALADPQVYVPGYAGVAGVVPSAGVYGAYPFAGGYVAGSPVVTKSAVYPYAAPYATPYATPYVAAVTYPSQDTSRGLPQPVQDTPAVSYKKIKNSKIDSKNQYYFIGPGCQG